MRVGLQSALNGLQINDSRMDLIGERLSSDVAVPFPQAMDNAANPAVTPLSVGENDGPGVMGAGTPPSPLPGLLPAGTLSSLGGDLAGDMGLFLVAKAAYQVNVRVVSAEARELKVLTDLG